MREFLKETISTVIKGGGSDKAKDFLLKIAKDQGYVKRQCRLNGELVMILVNDGKNPCDGCNIFECKGGGGD